MNVLDENVFSSQREQLKTWRIRVRQIGVDVGSKGLSDEDILPLLRRQKRPTLFTLDADFFQRSLCHARYCLVWLNIRPLEAAKYVRRVLRHPELNTQAKRMGKVIEAAPSGLTVWRLNQAEAETFDWPTRKR